MLRDASQPLTAAASNLSLQPLMEERNNTTKKQGSLNGTHFFGGGKIKMKQCKYMVILSFFNVIYIVCLGWQYNDP